MWKAPSRTRMPAARLTGSWCGPCPAAKAAQALAPSEQSTASPATTDASAASTASAPRSGSTASTVWPARSRAIRAGTCSAESPRLLARSPRRRGPRPGGAATAPPSAGALVGAAKERLVRLDHAAQDLARCRGRPQEAVPPAEARRQVDAAMGGRLGQAHPRRERLAVAQPALLLTQSRQRGAGQGVEGLAAGRAAAAA